MNPSREHVNRRVLGIMGSPIPGPKATTTHFRHDLPRSQTL
jgi:hypothetical protein